MFNPLLGRAAGGMKKSFIPFEHDCTFVLYKQLIQPRSVAPLPSVLGLILYKDSDDGEPPHTGSINVWFGANGLLAYTTHKETNTFPSFPELLRLSP